MKAPFFSLVLAGLSGLALAAPTTTTTTTAGSSTCNRDNCYRQVLGTYRTMSATNVAQCSSALACTYSPAVVTSTTTLEASTIVTTQTSTVTPDPVTVISTVGPGTVTVTATADVPSTVTNTVTSTSTSFTTTSTVYSGTSVAKRAVTGSVVCPTSGSVPTYASSCNYSRYQSACSCAGVTQTTVTASASTTIVTVTPSSITSTVSTTVTLSSVTNSVTSTLPSITTTETVTPPPATVVSTVTTTVNTATTIISPTPSTCGNSGLQWAYYRDNQKVDTASDSSNFDPTVIKTQQPLVNGVTPSTYISYPTSKQGQISIYGSANQASDYYIVDHRGWLFAPQSGDYSFSGFSIDDIVYVWLAGPAYSGWNKANAFQTIFYDNTQSGSTGKPTSKTTTVPLVAGNYYAIRIAFKQGPGTANFDYTIKGPDGQTLLSKSTGPSSYIVQYGCGDNGIAPGYPSYGQET